MPFNLTEFTSEINKSGFARSSFFMLMITLPRRLTSEFPEFGKSMQFRVEQAGVPTRQVLTHDQRYYGPVRRIPYGYTSMDMTMSVILSEDMREREVFMRWQDLMVGNSRTRRDGLGTTPTGIFDVGYYKDAVDGAAVELRTYATSPNLQNSTTSRSLLTEVTQIATAVGFDPTLVTSPYGFNLLRTDNRQIDAAYTVKLVEPFPIVVPEVPLNWHDDGYARLTVQMQYRYAQEVNSFKPNPSETNSSASVSSLLRNGITAFNRFQPTISLIRSEGLGGAIDTIGGQIEATVLNSVRGLFG